MRANEIITEAANLKKQAAIAIAMKKAGKKPKSEGVAEGLESGAKILYTGKDKSGTVTISYEPDYIPGHSEKYIIRFDGKVKSEMPTLRSAVYGLTHYQFDTFRPNLQPNPKTALEQGVAEGVARSFDPQLIQILKQRGFKGPMPVGRAKKWIPAVKEVAANGNFAIGADDIIMVSGTDPDYDPWVLYVPKLGKYIYNEGMAFNLLTAKQVVKFTVPKDDDDFFEGVAEGENWSKHNNKRVGGMSKKSVKSYRRSHPGSKIQTAVTTKPSKLKKGSKAAKRRKSFCARMKGMKKSRTSAKTARDPNSNINKSLRRWNCESIEQMEELVMLAEQMVAKARKEIL
jgi:hypothetical protein